MATWTGHLGAVGVVRWNPVKMMVASACSRVGMWIALPFVDDAGKASSAVVSGDDESASGTGAALSTSRFSSSSSRSLSPPPQLSGVQ